MYVGLLLAQRQHLPKVMHSQAAELGGRLRSRMAAGLEKHVPRLAAGLERQAPRVAAELERRVPALGRRMSPSQRGLMDGEERTTSGDGGQVWTGGEAYVNGNYSILIQYSAMNAVRNTKSFYGSGVLRLTGCAMRYR